MFEGEEEGEEGELCGWDREVRRKADRWGKLGGYVHSRDSGDELLVS